MPTSLEFYGTSDAFAVKGDRSRVALQTRWKPIQLAALSVLNLSRRDEETDERLWYFPVSRFEELQTLAPRNSKEWRTKAQFKPGTAYRKFGNCSITVSWKALIAIEATTGMRPAEASEVIRDLTGFQSPKGNYGSKAPRKDNNVTVIENARHTAMALLVQMLFGSDQGSANLFARLERPVRWLVSDTVALPSGGWSFDQSEESKQQGLGATSTIACIMALSQFVKICCREKLETVGLFDVIRQKVIQALPELVVSRTDRIWDFRNEGLSSETRTAESAYVISGLRFAIQRGALLELVSPQLDASQILRSLQMDLLSIAAPLERGWPADVGGLSVAPAATICSLHALSDLSRANVPIEKYEIISAAEERMLSDLRRDSGWEFLRTWDWATLAEIATARVGPITYYESNTLMKRIAKVRDAKLSGRLSMLTLRHLHPDSRKPVRYCLTRGEAVPLKDSFAAVVMKVGSAFIQKSGFAVWSAIISFVVALILAKHLGTK